MIVKGRGRFLLWLLGVSMLIAYLIPQLSVVSDIGQFMPKDRHQPQLQALMSEIQNGPSATNLMVRIYGADAATLTTLSTKLHQHLVEHKAIILEVHNGDSVQDWRLLQSLFPYRYLLSETADWSASALRKNFEQRITDMRTGVGAMISDMLVNDPTLEFLRYIQGLSAFTGPDELHGVWFDKELKSSLLLVQVRSKKLQLDIMQRAVDSIRKDFLKVASGTEAKIEIAGPGVMAVETRAAIEGVLQWLSLIMLVLLLVVFLVGYRSLHLIWLAAMPLGSGILVALVVTQTVFGEVHGIVLAFGVTLLGVCLDYPLHLFSHVRSQEAPVVSLKRIWPILRFGGVSSVVAFLALLGSGFSGLNQLAIFAASGLMTALMVTRYILPHLVFGDRISPRLLTLPKVLTTQQQVLIILMLISLPILIMVTTERFWETSVEAISPIPIAARQSDQVMRHALNIPEVSHVFLIEGKNIETVLQVSEEIYQELLVAKSQEIISNVWSPSQVLPSNKYQQKRQSSLPSANSLRQELNLALEDSPFRAESFDPWLKDVKESKSRKLLDYETVQNSLLGGILRQGLFRQGEVWLAAVRIGGVRSNVDFEQWVEKHPLLKSHHVQIRRATEQLLSDYRQATFDRLVVVLVILILLVGLWTRQWQRTWRIIVPVMIGLFAGLAVPLMLGVAINVFHLLALLLVLGMGLDYSLFFTTAGEDHLEQQQCLHATGISALTTSLAFLVLAFSSVPVLSAMGQSVSAGIALSFISAWIVASESVENLRRPAE